MVAGAGRAGRTGRERSVGHARRWPGRRRLTHMEKMVVEAERRVSFGKGANRKLRAKGMIPAVVYGQKKDSIPVAIDPKVLIRILRSHAGANTIFDLQVKGSDGTDNVMVKDYQLEPVDCNTSHTRDQ